MIGIVEKAADKVTRGADLLRSVAMGCFQVELFMKQTTMCAPIFAIGHSGEAEAPAHSILVYKKVDGRRYHDGDVSKTYSSLTITSRYLISIYIGK